MRYRHTFACAAVLLSLWVRATAFQSPFSAQGMGLETSPFGGREAALGYAGAATVVKHGPGLRNPSRTAFNTFTSFMVVAETDLDWVQDRRTSNTLASTGVPLVAANWPAGWLGTLGAAFHQRFYRDFTFTSTEEDLGYSATRKYAAGSYEFAFSYARSLGLHWAVGLGFHVLRGRDRVITRLDFQREDYRKFENDTLVTRREGEYPTLSVTYRQKRFQVAAWGAAPLEFEQRSKRTIGTLLSSHSTYTQYDFPLSVGMGFSFRPLQAHEFVLDWNTSDWDERIGPAINRAWQVGGGYEFLPQGNQYDPYFTRMSYRAGLGYERLYVGEVDLYRLTSGLGFPLGRRGGHLDLALEAGRRGTIENHAIQEDYVKVSVSLMGLGLWGQPSRRK